MLAELMRVLNHRVLGADTTRWTFEVDGRRAGSSIAERCFSPTDFPSSKLDKCLTEAQIVLMAVLASEVAFQINGKVAYLRVSPYQFQEDT